jgi:hypothetical protein
MPGAHMKAVVKLLVCAQCYMVGRFVSYSVHVQGGEALSARMFKE